MAELPREFEGTGASLIDIDTALEDCEAMVVLVDHDVFKSVPIAEWAGKAVYDTRGIWPDQPQADGERGNCAAPADAQSRPMLM